MLQDNPILKRAWNKAKKKKISKGVIGLDMRFNASKDFLEKPAIAIGDSVKRDGLTEKEIMDLVKFAFKK